MPTSTDYQFTSGDIERAYRDEEGDVTIDFNFHELSWTYFSKEDLLHLLKLIEETN